MFRGSSPVARSLRLLVAGAILAAGSLHFHEDAPASAWDRSQRDLLRSAESHPAAPLHVERAELQHTPRCPLCLLRDRRAAIGHTLSFLPDADRPTIAVDRPRAPALLHRADDPSRPRGPPLL